MSNQELKDRFKLRISIYKMKKENDNLKKEYNRKFEKKAIAACACFILISGVVFAKDINTFIFEKIRVLNISNENYAFYKDMKQEKGIYYKKVNSYEEYLKYKRMWPELLDMKKEDFLENFMIITAAENADTINKTLADVYMIEDSLYLAFEDSIQVDSTNVIIGTKLSREMERNNIRIVDKLNIAIDNNKYTKINNITKEYSKEKAIQEGCFVIENNKVISNNKESIKEFIENSKNNIESYIRICTIYDNKPLVITDISYRNQKYKFNILKMDDLNNITSTEYSFLKSYTSDRIGLNGERFTTIVVNNDNASEWEVKIMYIEE